MNLGPTVTLVDTNGNPLTISATIPPATLINSATSGSAGGAVTATITPPTGKTAIAYGFLLTYSNNVTTPQTLTVTLSDGGWTLFMQFNESNNINGNDFTPVSLWPGLLATAVGMPISLIVPAATGGGLVSVSLWGGSQ